MTEVNNTDVFQTMVAGLQDAGLSRTQICRQTGLSQATIWRAVHGEMRAPAFDTYDRLVRLAEKVGVPQSRETRPGSSSENPTGSRFASD
jgi:transcriptional regulator with XRE-family HTH domain